MSSSPRPSPSATQRAALALKAGDFGKARALLKNASATDLAVALIRGLAELEMEDWPAAAKSFRAGTAANPQNGQLAFNYASALENLGQTEEAARALELAITLGYAPPEAFGKLSNLARNLGRLSQAEALAEQALAQGLPRPEALSLLGLARARQARFDDASVAFEEATRLAPANALFWANRANLAADQLDFEAAWPFYAKARMLDDKPLFRRDEGMARLLAGDYTTAWPLYESRLELKGALAVPPGMTRWQGEDPQGKRLLILAEQGFGDTIQFCRMGSAFRQKGAALIWRVQQPLVRLLRANLPTNLLNEIVGFDAPWPEADFYLPMLSIPHALGLTAPTPSPLFKNIPTAPALPGGEGKRKIGLVWKGSATHLRDAERSIPLASFAPLWRKRQDTAFYAPCPDAAPDIKAANAPVIDLGPLIHDFADTAALLSQMDALVCVDTAPAHLAGALGVPTHLLLPRCPDWRWGTQGARTPWYDSLTIWRQDKPGDWGSVIERLEKFLETL